MFKGHEYLAMDVQRLGASRGAIIFLNTTLRSSKLITREKIIIKENSNIYGSISMAFKYLVVHVLSVGTKGLLMSLVEFEM